MNKCVFVRRQIGQLKISLKSVQDTWSQYKQASEEINVYLTEGRYSVSRFRLLTGSLEAAQLQVQSLQVNHILNLGVIQKIMSLILFDVCRIYRRSLRNKRAV